MSGNSSNNSHPSVQADQKSTPIKLGLERSPYKEDGGHLIGRNPHSITANEWLQIVTNFKVGLDAIRANCLECSYTPGEVRKCVCINCPLWPFRLGCVPKAYREAMRQANASK